jgi:hypothetical protein
VVEEALETTLSSEREASGLVDSGEQTTNLG